MAPNSPDFIPRDCHVWEVMLEHCETFYPKPINTDELKKVLQLIWNQLPQDSLNKAILSFTKTHRDCVKGGMDIWNVLWEKLFNDVEHWTLQVIVYFFGVILKYGIKYCKSCNSWTNKNILVKFSGIVENCFCCKCKSRTFRLSRDYILSSGTFLSHLICSNIRNVVEMLSLRRHWNIYDRPILLLFLTVLLIIRIMRCNPSTYEHMSSSSTSPSSPPSSSSVIAP